MTTDGTLLQSQTKTYLDLLSMPIMVFYPNGELVYVNPALENVISHSQAEIIGQPLWSLAPTEDAPYIQTQFHVHLIHQQAFQLTVPLVARESIQHFLWDVQPIADTDLLIATGNPQAAATPPYYELIAKHMRDIVGVLDIDARILYINPTIEQITGWKQEELLGIRPVDFTHPDDVEKLRQLTIQEYKEKNSSKIEYRFRKKDGTYTWLEVVIQVIPNDTGPPYRLIFASREINERKEAEQALIESEKHFRWVAENSTDAIAIYSPEGVCQYASPAFKHILGYNAEDMIGSNAYEFFHPDDIPQITKSHESVLSHPDISTVRYRIRHNAGHYIWVETTSQSIRDSETDEIIELQTSTRDISERMQSQEDLLKSESWHRQIFRKSQAVQILIDPKTGKIVDANESALKFYGYDYDQLTSMNINEINTLTQAEISLAMNQAHSEGLNFFRFKHKLANANIRDVEVFSSPITIDGQDVLYSIVVDITNRLKAEQERAHLQSRFRALFEKNNDAVVLFGLDTLTHEVNAEAEKLFGYTKEEMIGTSAFLRIADSHKTDAQGKLAALLSGETLPIYERTFLRKDGSTFIGESNVALIYNAEGHPSHIQSIVRDISERKETERILRENETRYRTMIDMMAEGVVLHDPDGTIVQFNQSALDALGLSEDQFLGRTPIDPNWRTIHLDGSPFPGDAHPASVTLATGQPQFNVMMGVYKGDNSLSWLQVNSRPLYLDDKNKSLFGVLVSFSDVTELYRAREAIIKSEARFRSIFHHAPTGIVTINREGAIITANPTFQDMSGYTFDELQTLASFMPLIYEDDREVSRKALDDIQNKIVDHTRIEKRYIRKDGSIFDGVAHLVSIEGDESFQPEIFTLAIIEDVTEQKHAEQARLAFEVERQRTQVLTTFITNASHEFRTPLSIINTSLYLANKVGNDEARHNIQMEKITQQVIQINSLVDELLMMSRLDAIIELDKFALDISEIIKQTEARLLTYAIENGVQLIVHVAPNLPRIKASAEYLYTAMFRLVENGIRYTKAGGAVTVRARQQDNELKITITDTGIGIPKEVIPHIFERFYRLDEAHSTRGFGLGLSIAKHVIELHDGEINVTSTEGKGSQFIVSLPLNPS